MNASNPILNAYWVVPGRLLAGEYPVQADEAHSRRRIAWLLESGVNFFLDLTEAGEPGLKPYAGLLQAEAGRLGQSAQHRRIPIPDFTAPSPARMIEILDALEDALAAGCTVYLHCHGGIGRTGTVVGCYLARAGQPGQAALQQIAAWRQRTPSGGDPSPETDLQRRMVLDWHPGQ